MKRHEGGAAARQRLAEQGDVAANEARAEAFRALFRAQHPSIVAYALRRCETEDDAHDVAAEVFTVAWRRFDEIPAGDAARAWLFGVARRCLSTQRRGRLRRVRFTQVLVEGGAAGEAIDDGENADDRVALVRAALARLRLADREILQLAAWEELPHRQIAIALGISENAVAIRLHRARERLRCAMEDVKGQS